MDAEKALFERKQSLNIHSVYQVVGIEPHEVIHHAIYNKNGEGQYKPPGLAAQEKTNIKYSNNEEMFRF